jgi:hypothetical protein
VFCVLISLEVWLVLNFQHNPAATSTYVFAFMEDITIPSGGQKVKDMAQTIFDGGFIGDRNSKLWDSWLVIPSGGLSRHTFAILYYDEDTQGRSKEGMVPSAVATSAYTLW